MKAGQLMALIDSPEIDAQVEQASATLAESEAALQSAIATENLSETSVGRLRRLIESNSIPQQDLDEAEANLLVNKARTSLARATIDVNKANLRRATELQSFSKIYAPFDGVVTQRSVDQGQLITAGNSEAQSLFRISKTNPLRVFINVPQAYASNVKQGLSATLVVRDMPGREFKGTVTAHGRSDRSGDANAAHGDSRSQ
ncbi:MAG: efflux RND transporter periplasmic adaptor subunit [Pirellulales bacterium]